MKFLPILAIFLSFDALFFAYTNYSTIVDFKVLETGMQISLAYIILFVLLNGIVTGALLAYSFYLASQSRLKEYQRKLEKTSVQSSEDSSRVAVLESKIEVLEKALKSALER